MSDNIQTNTTGRLTPCLQQKLQPEHATAGPGAYDPRRACHHARRQVHPATAGPAAVLLPEIRFETASQLPIHGGGGQEEKRLFAGAAYLPPYKKAQSQRAVHRVRGGRAGRNAHRRGRGHPQL